MSSDIALLPPDPPLVSVICPFLDEERYLAEAVESVLAQDYPAFELILVDDGSTDGSSALARALAAREPDRVFCIDHPGHANRGPAASRNAGIAAARGSFLAFIDGDDVWRPGKLTQQVAILANDPALGAVFGTVNYWSAHAGRPDRLVPTGHLSDATCAPHEALLRLHPLGRADAPCPSDMLMRRSAIEATGGFDERFVGDLRLYEDQTLFARLFLDWPVHFSSQVWLDYRQHPDSCVATAWSDGTADIARRAWLDWLEAELAARKMADRRLFRAIARARWALDHPVMARCSAWLWRQMRQLQPLKP